MIIVISICLSSFIYHLFIVFDTARMIRVVFAFVSEHTSAAATAELFVGCEDAVVIVRTNRTCVDSFAREALNIVRSNKCCRKCTRRSIQIFYTKSRPAAANAHERIMTENYINQMPGSLRQVLIPNHICLNALARTHTDIETSGVRLFE